MQNPYPEKTARWWFYEYLPKPWKREAILAAKLYPIYPIVEGGSEMIFDRLENALATGFKWNESDEETGTKNDRWFHWNRIMSLYNEDMADTTSIAESFTIPSDGTVLHKPEPEYNRAELIQLTAAALSGLLASDQIDITSYNLAASAVQCAEAALKIINQKQQP